MGCQLSIVIVSWNTKNLLKKCLESIFARTKTLGFEVIVVDNNSTDGTREQIANSKWPIAFVENEKNLGFAKANNQGIEKSKGEFILLLNPDTEIKNGALEKMVQLMRERPDCGVAGCKILNPDGSLQPSVRRFPDFLSSTLISLNFHSHCHSHCHSHRFNLFARAVDRYLARDFDYSKNQEADQVMGAFFMTRREVIEKIGNLDEKFFIWFEEVDFCKRAKEAGFKVMYTPEAEIIHHGAASFSQAFTYEKQKIFSRSLIYYFKKHRQYGAYFLSLLFHPLRLVLGLGISFFQKNRRRL